MKIIWKIEKSDIKAIKRFYEDHKSNAFVQNRIKTNTKRKDAYVFSKKIFWKAMISCLLTTQQRSGPNSAVSRFLFQHKFPLDYKICLKSKDIKGLAHKTLSKFGGIRRSETISREISWNFKWLNSGGWEFIKKIAKDLSNEDTPDNERKSAEMIIEKLRGFGPKQARNLLQQLGLTKYEIPIDSRITKWMNQFGFPITLSATGLADKHYYNFIVDGFKEMCEAINVYPCVMDAVIFSSFDKIYQWTEDNVRN